MLDTIFLLLVVLIILGAILYVIRTGLTIMNIVYAVVGVIVAVIVLKILFLLLGVVLGAGGAGHV